MDRQPVSTHRRGVVCIFCSMRSPLPVSLSDERPPYIFAAPNPLLSLIRCQWCGKEAQYRASEIIILQEAAAPH